jgi:hypothetical protein
MEHLYWLLIENAPASFGRIVPQWSRNGKWSLFGKRQLPRHAGSLGSAPFFL